MKNTNQIVKMIYLILQIGFTMLVTVFMCIGLGFLIKKWTGVNLIGLFIVLGVVAGVKAAYILIKKFVSFENPDDEYINMIQGNRDSNSVDDDDDEDEGMRP